MEIRLEQTGRKFNTEWIFRNLTYTFESHSAYAVLGRNGSGKSTLLQVIAGNLHPSEGTVHYSLSGHAVSDTEIFRHLALVAPYQELIEEFTQCLPVDFKGIADSPDGSRRVLWTGPISRLDLRFRQDAGPWTTVDTGLSDLPFVWFDSWNRVEILVRASHYPGADGKEPYAVFSEP